MREIKFRAWEENAQYMNDNVRITRTMGETFYEVSEAFGWIEVKPEYVMQHTGMRDKNGKEIYEGDILYHKLQGKRKVYYPFDDRVASFGLEQMDNGMKSTLQDADRVYEVIGNIYENPELLEN